MLSKGVFRNLYTLGYDLPEGYTIEKDGKMFYAFFGPEGPQSGASARKGPAWGGEIELRGLEPVAYRVFDYVNQKDYGTLQGPTAKLKTSFADNLLLEAVPITADTTHVVK